MKANTTNKLTRRGFAAMLGMAAAASLIGCGGVQGNAADGAEATSTKADEEPTHATPSTTGPADGKATSPEPVAENKSDKLVLIYSRADENYNVGYIETGNTRVLADFIAQKTGAQLFELVPANPYPADYQSCIDQALEEQHRGDRPALVELPDLSAYKTIYFGFPVWWGDIPMPVYTAIEALDWSDKTIAPFNTHEGSGSAGMFDTLAQVCGGATVLDGLTMTGSDAQNNREAAEQAVDGWLAGLGI